MKVINYDLTLKYSGEKPSLYIDRPTFDSLGIPKHKIMIEGWYYELFEKAEKDKVYTFRLDDYQPSRKLTLEAIEYLISNGYTLSEKAALRIREMREDLEAAEKRSEEWKKQQEQEKENDKTVLICRKYGCEMKSVLECSGCKRKDYEECLPEKNKN